MQQFEIEKFDKVLVYYQKDKESGIDFIFCRLAYNYSCIRLYIHFMNEMTEYFGTKNYGSQEDRFESIILFESVWNIIRHADDIRQTVIRANKMNYKIELTDEERETLNLCRNFRNQNAHFAGNIPTHKEKKDMELVHGLVVFPFIRPGYVSDGKDKSHRAIFVGVDIPIKRLHAKTLDVTEGEKLHYVNIAAFGNTISLFRVARNIRQIFYRISLNEIAAERSGLGKEYIDKKLRELLASDHMIVIGEGELKSN